MAGLAVYMLFACTLHKCGKQGIEAFPAPANGQTRPDFVTSQQMRVHEPVEGDTFTVFASHASKGLQPRPSTSYEGHNVTKRQHH